MRLLRFAHAAPVRKSAFHLRQRKCAFTLAEVLITLTIIGVVAALTLPSLTATYKRHETETKLKRFYSVMNEAIRLSEIDNGNKMTWDYGSYSPKEFFNKYFAKYLKTVKTEGEGDEFFVYFADGSKVGISNYGKDYSFFVNASKDYDTAVRGKDEFVFLFAPSHTDIDYKFSYNKGLEPYTLNWDGTDEALITHERYGCRQDALFPNFCTKLIQLNGWKIPDNYPW